MAMKGPSEDISLGFKAVELLGGGEPQIIDYQLEDESRRIVFVKKISHTPTKYPRNSSQIKKKLL